MASRSRIVGLRAWGARGWRHVATLLEKPNVPGSLPLTLGTLALVLAYLLVISFL